MEKCPSHLELEALLPAAKIIKFDDITGCGDNSLHLPSTSGSGKPSSYPTLPGSRKSSTKSTKCYNANWENDPLLKPWIIRPSNSLEGRVTCRFCKPVTLVRCHKADLLEHVRTLKHQKNYKSHCTPEIYNLYILSLNGRQKVEPTQTPPASASSFDWNTMLNMNLSSNNHSGLANLANDGTKITVVDLASSPDCPDTDSLQTLDSTGNNYTTLEVNTDAVTTTTVDNSYNHCNTIIDTTAMSTLLGNGSTMSGPEDSFTTELLPTTSTVVDFDELWQDNIDYITNIPAADSPRDLVTVVLDDESALQPSSYSSEFTLSSLDAAGTSEGPYVTRLDEDLVNRAHESLNSINAQQLDSTQFGVDHQMDFVFENELLLQPNLPETLGIENSATAAATSTNPLNTIFNPAEFISAVQNNYFTLDEVCSVAMACISHVKNMVNMFNIQTISIHDFSGSNNSSSSSSSTSPVTSSVENCSDVRGTNGGNSKNVNRSKKGFAISNRKRKSNAISE